ncbi:maleylacetoacetate isomerase [Sphingomonas solaris]|uniref:Maleylacetoacetate isomerase n=1 Tax=Alterirhizorhabdus solaris TaxID=2529389 RepID=A0A558QVS4_9SPHN|nr:maleylacetoacetate isomerase [Sphingomonas solaris]TVV71172.1 maleylacetoacetate isomerase [Sphingomonas solaris]
MPLTSPTPARLRLHGYWRSGTTYRVRIALGLKGLGWETVPVNLLEGAQKGEAYRRLQPQGLVPALEADGLVIAQSPAILEWIEETYPDPPLLPSTPADRAAVRAMAAAIACDIHPLHNPRVFARLKQDHAAAPADTEAWAAHWIAEGLAALEQLVARHGGGLAFGDRPTLADCYLVPQIYTANRFHVDLSPYPRLVAAAAAAGALPAVAAAHPAAQPDAPPAA